MNVNGLPPGLQGWVLADVMRQQQQELALKQQQGQMQMQVQRAALEQAAEQRRQQDALRRGAAEAGNDPQALAAAALKAGDVKTYLDITKMIREEGRLGAAEAHTRAQTAEINNRQDAFRRLGQALDPNAQAIPQSQIDPTQPAPQGPVTNMMFGPGSQPPQGVNNPAMQGRPPAEQAAIAALIAQGAQQPGAAPVRAHVPNPANIDALMARIAPQQFVTQSMRPPPQSRERQVIPVTGGYLEQQPDGTRTFVRTQQDRPEPRPPQRRTTEIVDPLNTKQMLRVYEDFDEQAYRAGDRSKVLGVSGKEPGFAKREEKESQGKELLQSEIDNLRTDFRELRDAGAITSSDADPGSNVAAYVRSSTPGQALGRVFGTKEQDARNRIQSAKLRLLNAIKNATGMTAQQLNSNIELQTWLNSLTSLGNSYESNIGVLDAIENAFLKDAKPIRPAGSPPAGGGGKVIRFDAQGNIIP